MFPERGARMDNRSMIVGHSAEIKAVLHLIEVFCDSTATALVTGESGSGKELVAQALHHKSRRAKGPFIAVNCAAIPRELLESELFGHRKGAFSGALADRMGRFELANGGTIFLDEIGDMSLDMQSKMLRVLQEGVVDPIGSSRQVRVDVRVVAATHRDLETECATARFREDLFYRLNVLPITVPALRNRSEDIPELMAHFALKHGVPGAPPVSFDAEFLDLLMKYSWPGNIRELSNFVHRVGIMCPGKRLSWWTLPPEMFSRKMREMFPVRTGAEETSMPEAVFSQPPLRLEHAPSEAPSVARRAVPHSPARPERVVPTPGRVANLVEEIILIAHGKMDFPVEGVCLKERLAEVEKKVICRALDHTGGNISRTAELLSLQRTTLIQKLNKLKGNGLEEVSFSSERSSLAA